MSYFQPGNNKFSRYLSRETTGSTAVLSDRIYHPCWLHNSNSEMADGALKLETSLDREFFFFVRLILKLICRQISEKLKLELARDTRSEIDFFFLSSANKLKQIRYIWKIKIELNDDRS